MALQLYDEAHHEIELLFNAAEATPREDIVYQRTVDDLSAAGLIPKDAVQVAPVPEDYTAKHKAYNQAILKAFADDDPAFSPMDGPLRPGELEALIQGIN